VDLGNLKTVFSQRPRILWLVLGAMLLVSVLPLALYHRQVLQLSQGKLTDTESVQQTEVTRSLAEDSTRTSTSNSSANARFWRSPA
jgi:hypothetical protein